MDARGNELESLRARLKSVEERLAILESLLAERKVPQISEEPNFSSGSPYDEHDILNEEDKGLESKIGRIGLAWMGMIVLLFGVIFFEEYILGKGHRLFFVIIGYLSAVSIYLISNYLKKTNATLSLMFHINGLLILFYVTMRLHFFSAVPVISGKAPVLGLLLLIVAYSTFLSFRKDQQVFGLLAVVFTLITGVVSDSTHIMLPLVSAACGGTLFYFHRNRWKALLTATIVLSYLVFFLWILSNPFMGNPMKLLANHEFGYIYLFAIGGCFSLLPVFRDKDGSLDEYIISMIIVNGMLFTMLLGFVTISYFRTDYVGLFAVITISCLGYSVILKKSSEWNFPPAFFALYGFMAMSISLYGMVGLPVVYLLLSVQSLIVVSMALWFRNRLIIIMNSLLFLLILFIYLVSSKPVSGANFSFALVALVSARIINWKRERLEIKTDFIRNLYLIEGFFMVLFALYHSVPKQFITLSWTIAALFYFGLSFLLKNVKYRYLALGTMISAAIYLFVVDLARIEMIYRILALLALAVVSIGISIYYTNRIKKGAE